MLAPWAAVRWTGRADGDALRRREGPARGWERVVDRPVFWLHQVHGDGVVVVEHPTEPAVRVGDALVTTREDVALGVLTADCAPVALASPEGVVGAAHAGWAGLAGGILERTVDAMRSLGARRVEAALGPCIHPECYQFGPAELDRLVARFGESVRGRATGGAPALDLPAAVAAALELAGADLVYDVRECTACAADPGVKCERSGESHRRQASVRVPVGEAEGLPDRYFSHRARGEAERQAMVVWRA